MREGRTGKPMPAAARARVAAAMRARAETFVPNGRRWTPEEGNLVRTLPPPDVAGADGPDPQERVLPAGGAGSADRPTPWAQLW